MNKFESEIELIVINRFTEALINTYLLVKSEDRWKTAILPRLYDIVIYKGAHPLAVVEIKRSLKNKNI